MAFELVEFFQKMSINVGDAGACFDPWRVSMVAEDTTEKWLAAGFTIAGVEELRAITTWSLNHENSAPAIRLSGDFSTIIQDELTRYWVGNVSSVADVIKNLQSKTVAEQARLDALFGDDYVLNQYRKSLGLNEVERSSGRDYKAGVAPEVSIYILAGGAFLTFIVSVWVCRSNAAQSCMDAFLYLVTAPEIGYILGLTFTSADCMSDVLSYVFVIQTDEASGAIFKSLYLSFTALAIGLTIVALIPQSARLIVVMSNRGTTPKKIEEAEAAPAERAQDQTESQCCDDDEEVVVSVQFVEFGSSALGGRGAHPSPEMPLSDFQTEFRDASVRSQDELFLEKFQRLEHLASCALFLFEDVPFFCLNVWFIMGTNSGEMKFSWTFLTSFCLTLFMMGAKATKISRATSTRNNNDAAGFENVVVSIRRAKKMRKLSMIKIVTKSL